MCALCLAGRARLQGTSNTYYIICLGCRLATSKFTASSLTFVGTARA